MSVYNIPLFLLFIQYPINIYFNKKIVIINFIKYSQTKLILLYRNKCEVQVAKWIILHYKFKNTVSDRTIKSQVKKVTHIKWTYNFIVCILIFIYWFYLYTDSLYINFTFLLIYFVYCFVNYVHVYFVYLDSKLFHYCTNTMKRLPWQKEYVLLT